MAFNSKGLTVKAPRSQNSAKSTIKLGMQTQRLSNQTSNSQVKRQARTRPELHPPPPANDHKPISSDPNPTPCTLNPNSSTFNPKPKALPIPKTQELSTHGHAKDGAYSPKPNLYLRAFRRSLSNLQLRSLLDCLGLRVRD